MKLSIALATVLFAQVAFAQLMPTTAGTTKLEGVTLATKGKSATGVELTMVGAGLRKKKQLGITAKVYVAQIFLSAPESFVHSDDAALKTAALSKSVAVQLSFLRTVDADKVQSSFVDALLANKVDMTDADVKAFLAAIKNGGDAENKKTLTILVEKADNQEILQYEDTAGKSTKVVAKSGLMEKVLSIWLGVSADDELAACKKQIIGQ